MPATRARVRPPHSHKGLFILAALYGLSCGALFVGGAILLPRILSRIADALSDIFGFAIVPILILIVLFTPPCCAALYMARCCQHRGPVYLAGQLVGSCYVLGMLLVAFVLEGGQLAGAPWWLPLVIGSVYPIAVGIFCGLINLLFSTVYYHFVAVLVPQDGTLCAACGYPVAQVPSDRCPECGTPKDTPMPGFGRIYRTAEFLARHARKFVLLASMLVVCAAGAYVWHQFPVWRFISKFGSQQSSSMGLHIPVGASPSTTMARGIEFSRQVEGAPAGAVLVIQQYREHYFHPPRMQIRIAQWVNMGAMGPLGQPVGYHMEGLPRIVCELDEIQSAYVLENDLPPELVQALIIAAHDADWTPMPASGPAFPAKPDVQILPDQYFPITLRP